MDYIDDLKAAIRRSHGCDSSLRIITPVKELFQDKVAWEGDVAVFDLIGHPTAKRCYAWGHPSDDDAPKREITTVLDVPPVVSPETAVKAAIAAKGKSR